MFIFAQLAHTFTAIMKRFTIVGLLLLSMTTMTFGMRGGSSVTSPAKYPYQVSIRIWPEDTNNCGGTILDENHILTAGSCAYGWFEADLRIGVGSNRLNEGTIYEIDSYRVHQNYDPATNANDIAIIKTKEPIAMVSNSVSTVTLGTTDPTVNTGATEIGWGNPVIDPENSENDLQELATTVQDRSNCDPEGFVEQVSSEQICTLNDYGQGACNGDFGGPLLVNGAQVGIISFFKTTIYEPQCGNALPMVHTSVSAYASWIEENRNF